MITLFNHGALWIAILTLAASSAVAKEDKLPDVTEDGLHRVPDSRMAVVYADPEADFSGYQRVQLLDAYVAFRKNWERDQRSTSISSTRVTSSDVEKIKQRLADEFHAVFTESLVEGGYPVVDQAALHGLLKKVRDLGMPLLSVNPVEPDQADKQTHQ